VYPSNVNRLKSPRARSVRIRRARAAAESLEARRLLAAGPQRLGDEFLLNEVAGGDQSAPALAADPAGNFVAAWTGPDAFGTGVDVYGRRLPASAPAGPEFRVVDDSTGDQRAASVAASASGSVVVWQKRASATADGDVAAQMFDPDGNRHGFEFPVNADPAGNQMTPAAGMTADGGFVVAWRQNNVAGVVTPTIAARLFDADGNPRGPSFPVSTDADATNVSPVVGVGPDGGFVVVWQGTKGGEWDVFGRRYAPDGAPLSEPVPMTFDAAPDARDPSVAMAPDGSLLVAWMTPGVDLSGGAAGDGSGYGVFARRFGPDLAPLGDVVPVNVHTDGDQLFPAVAAARDGSFLVTWEGAAQDGDGAGVFARRLGADGKPASDEFQVNTFTAGDQGNPSVAAAPDGRFLVAWQSAAQDGSGFGVYGQMFAADPPAEDPPTVSVADAAVTEGDPGATADAVFTVTLSGARSYPVTVGYATKSGTATSPADYATASGTLTFAPGLTSKTVTVKVAGDALDETDETFTLELADPLNATVARGSATGVIADDDPLPQMTIDDASAVEGDFGDTADVVMKVSLSVPSGRPITVAYVYGMGGGNTATRGTDYEGVSSVLTFSPGETEKFVTTPIIPDGLYEGPETFSVTLSYVETPTFLIPDDGAAVGTIVDDDVAPRVTAGAVTVTEGNDPAGQLVTIPVTLSGVSSLPVTVDYATADDTAVAPGDYTPASGTLTFAPGETAKSVQVRVIGDSVEEPVNERLLLKLSNAQGAGPEDGSVTVVDDDALPAAVTGVYVGSTSWSAAFLQHLAATGAGSEQFGFLVGEGAAQLDELPWTNLNQLGIRFSRDVVALAPAISVHGVTVADYPVRVTYDVARSTAILTFDRPLPADRLTLRLAGTGSATGPDVVRDRLGRPIDGEWGNAADAYPSGDGTPGGDFVFSFNVLPGDVNRDGLVDARDVTDVRSRLSSRAAQGGTAGPYAALDDVNGTGSIDVLDYAQVRARQQTKLPAPPAPAAAAGLPLAGAPRRAPVRRDLFGSAPILA
jgi:hypothetical protein